MSERDEIQQNKMKKREEDERLAHQARDGCKKAREELIVNHLYLVKRLMGIYVGKGTPEDVLFQEGCYGLILAVDRYDPDKGASLDTYATYYVNKYLRKAMAENFPHPIMLKEKSSAKAKRYRQAIEELTEKNGYSPTNQELADYLDISYQEATSLMAGVLQVVPLDTPAYTDRPPAQLCGRPAEAEVLQHLNEISLDAFPTPLTKREKIILHLRFGSGPDNQPLTFSQIGEILGLSDYTVSCLYSEAIEKLRSVKDRKRI